MAWDLKLNANRQVNVWYHAKGKDYANWARDFYKEKKRKPHRFESIRKMKEFKLPHIANGRIYVNNIYNPSASNRNKNWQGQYGYIDIEKFSKAATEFFKNTSAEEYKEAKKLGEGSSMAGNNFYQMVRKYAMDNNMPEASGIPQLVSNNEPPSPSNIGAFGNYSNSQRTFYQQVSSFFSKGYFGGTSKFNKDSAWADTKGVSVDEDRNAGFGGYSELYEGPFADYSDDTFVYAANNGQFNENTEVIGGLRGDYIGNEWYDAWRYQAEQEQEEEAKEFIGGGVADYADSEGGGSFDSKYFEDDAGGGLNLGDYSDTSSKEGSGTGYSGKSPIDPETQLYEGEKKDDDYVASRIPKTAGIREVLGEEIFNLGLKDESGNYITPESLSQFATYTSEDGTEQPLIDYENALVQKVKEGDKDAGVDARSLLAIRAKQGVMGAASAAGKSVQQTVQDVTMGKMADRQSASSAMSARVSAIEDKLQARQQLSKLKTELLTHNLKREQDLYKLKSKTAVGLAGLEETAASFAREMIQIKGS